MKYIYAKRYSFGRPEIHKFIFVRETKTLIISRLGDWQYRFKKDTGEQYPKMGYNGDTSYKIVSYEDYRKYHNKAIDNFLFIGSQTLSPKDIERFKASKLPEQEVIE